MEEGDWSSDVCSSDLRDREGEQGRRKGLNVLANNCYPPPLFPSFNIFASAPFRKQTSCAQRNLQSLPTKGRRSAGSAVFAVEPQPLHRHVPHSHTTLVEGYISIDVGVIPCVRPRRGGRLRRSTGFEHRGKDTLQLMRKNFMFLSKFFL